MLLKVSKENVQCFVVLSCAKLLRYGSNLVWLYGERHKLIKAYPYPHWDASVFLRG